MRLYASCMQHTSTGSACAAWVWHVGIHNKDSLAHDHQRCLGLLLLLLHFPHHLQHGVNWRTALPWPGAEVEQGHFMGQPRALERRVFQLA